MLGNERFRAVDDGTESGEVVEFMFSKPALAHFLAREHHQGDGQLPEYARTIGSQFLQSNQIDVPGHKKAHSDAAS